MLGSYREGLWSNAMKALLLAVAIAAGAAATALAATETAAPANTGARECFSAVNWRGWKARDEHTMYLRVNTNDLYEVGFKHSCSRATSPGVHLVTVFRGSANVCSPIDLDIKVNDNFPGAIATPCIATSLRKLSDAEAKALPKEVQP